MGGPMDGWMDGWMRIMRHESLIVYFWRNIYLESDVSCKGGNTSRLPKYEILIVLYIPRKLTAMWTGSGLPEESKMGRLEKMES